MRQLERSRLISLYVMLVNTLPLLDGALAGYPSFKPLIPRRIIYIFENYLLKYILQYIIVAVYISAFTVDENAISD